MVSKFVKYYYNKMTMKNRYKIAVLSSVFMLALTGCTSTEISEFYLETSNTFEYSAGKCFQASRNNVVDTTFVFNLPLNPEANSDEYEYDLVWNEVLNIQGFTFVNGLEGKAIIEVFRISDTVLKINFDGKVYDNKATFGYLKISPETFRAKTKRVRDTFLYVYIAIGDNSGLIDKPIFEDK